MRKNTLNIIYIAVFAVALILAITAFAQNLRPLASIINSQKRVAEIAGAQTQIDALAAALKPYKKFVFIFSSMYLPAILLFLYMIVSQVFIIFNIKMPKFALSAVGLVNTILLLIVLFSVNNWGSGLGLSPRLETTANYYSWYTAPEFAAESNIYHFAPTFHTVIMPLLFLGVLPFIYGIKRLIIKNEVAKNQQKG